MLVVWPAEAVVDGSEHSYEARKGARMEAEVLGAERRRRWTDDQKLAIVRETLRPGAAVTLVARRYGIGTGLIYTWRKQMLSAVAGVSGAGFLPCEIVGDEHDAALDAAVPVMVPPPVLPQTDIASSPPASSFLPASSTSCSSAGTIDVDLPGGTRLRIDGAADAGTLKLLLDALSSACR